MKAKIKQLKNFWRLYEVFNFGYFRQFCFVDNILGCCWFVCFVFVYGSKYYKYYIGGNMLETLKYWFDCYLEKLADVLVIISDIIWCIFEMIKFILFIAIHIGLLYLVYIGIKTIF